MIKAEGLVGNNVVRLCDLSTHQRFDLTDEIELQWRKAIMNFSHSEKELSDYLNETYAKV